MRSMYRRGFKPYVLACGLLLQTHFSAADTLQEIYEQALRNDPQLKADIAAYEAGKENKKIGLSNILPSISGSGSYQKFDGDVDGVDFDLDALVVQPFSRDSGSTVQTWSATLRQPLFDMQAWYGYQQGNTQSDLAAAEFGTSQQAFIIRVASAYIDVLRAIDTIETSLAERRALESQLEQTKQRFEVGLTAITDVHEAQAQYDSVNANTLLAQGQVAIAFEALEVLTGQASNTIAPIADNFPVTVPAPADRQAWVDFALDNNYSLKSAQLNAEVSRLSALSRQAAHYPTLSGTLNISNQDTDTTAGLGFPDVVRNQNSISLDLSIPIYSGGSVSAQRRQAYQQEIQAREQYNRTQRETVQNARSLHLSVETDVAQVAARRQAIVSNQSALEATQAGYEVGTRNLVDVLQAQRLLYQAQRAYYTALYDYIINTLRLKETAGNLTPEDIEELNRYLDSANQINRSSFQ